MREIDYRPKHGLQFKFLRMFMTKKELEAMTDKYVKAKVAYFEGKYPNQPKRKYGKIL